MSFRIPICIHFYLKNKLHINDLRRVLEITSDKLSPFQGILEHALKAKCHSRACVRIQLLRKFRVRHDAFEQD